MNWLEPRLTDVPESLLGRIADAVKDGQAARRSGGQIADMLQLTGEALMRDAQYARPTRDTAMTLLTADALITYACEAIAEQEPEKLAELR